MSELRGPVPEGLYAPFRPVRGPLVARVLAVASGLGALFLALFTPGDLGWFDRGGFLAVGAALVVFLHLQATVAAVPSPQGLRVRNLVHRQDLAWAQVVGVSFGGGRPWVQLDLSDGDVLAVMGVQRADGARADAEAARLATLVALHAPRGDRA